MNRIYLCSTQQIFQPEALSNHLLDFFKRSVFLYKNSTKKFLNLLGSKKSFRKNSFLAKSSITLGILTLTIPSGHINEGFELVRHRPR